MPFVIGSFNPFENVRTTDPDTSHLAARKAKVTEVQRRVLRIHQRHPDQGLTDGELLAEYEREWLTPESSPRKRRHDLTKAGLIEDTGTRRQSGTSRCIVWRLTALGKVTTA